MVLAGRRKSIALFIALGAQNQSVLDHLLVMAGAVMLGAGLSAQFALTFKIERRLAAWQENLK